MKRLELFRNRLYQKAKEDKERKFYTLHDKLCRTDILEEAWKNVAANHGTAGIDNQTIEDIKAYGTDRFLGELQQELINETYTVSDVRRVFIPKPDGKERPLGIPTVKDRIVQQAVKSIIEPIYEADFQEFSYAYRPNRSAKQASEEISKYLNFGCTNVIFSWFMLSKNPLMSRSMTFVQPKFRYLLISSDACFADLLGLYA